MQTEEILIPITFFVATAVILYNFFKSRHAERMAIIDKGLNEEQLSYLLKTRARQSNNGWSLKIGAIAVGVGIAILIGASVPYDIQDEVVAGLVFLLPGIGLLLVYRFAKTSGEEQ